jgi:FAD/FMN-containing dehydrogenase
MAGPRSAVSAEHWPAQGDRSGPWLPFGAGRSYGDTAIVPGGVALDTAACDRILGFDSRNGRVQVEAGASLAKVLEHVVPGGWFLPVCPGTAAVTVGGAIAHDVHGKNHPTAGTFGRHVLGLELLRSDGERQVLTPQADGERFRATVGGLGLTGLILSAELQLVPIQSSAFIAGRRRQPSLNSLLATINPPGSAEYRLIWVDSLHPGRTRLVEYYADHAAEPGAAEQAPSQRLRLPIATPAWCFNRPLMALCNRALFRTTPRLSRGSRRHFSRVLFPQDWAHPSNRLYGSRGVFAYHALIPKPAVPAAIPELLARVAAADARSMVTVLKPFGALPAPGMLSFSGEGYSFVAGFPNEGQRTLSVLADLDRIVAAAQGKLYPAKDARLPAAMFRSSFPEWERFAAFVDPAFDSRFWRRVTGRELER